MLGDNERLPYMFDGRIWNTPRATCDLCQLVRKLIWGASVVLLRVLTRLDKITTTNICHDFYAWIDADAQLLQLREISGRGHLEKRFNYPAERPVTQH
jgi:hypothetical protein